MLPTQAQPSTFAPHRISGLLLALGPPGLAILIIFMGGPTLGHPMFSEPVAPGIDLGVVVTTFAVSWGAIGGYIVATSRRPWVLPLALVVFTFPATLAIVLGPAIVLILQNLRA
jgi:hypothetical protein